MLLSAPPLSLVLLLVCMLIVVMESFVFYSLNTQLIYYFWVMTRIIFSNLLSFSWIWSIAINTSFLLVSCMILTLTYILCREALLSYITSGDDVHVLGSLSVLATLLQTKGYIIEFIHLTSLISILVFWFGIWIHRIGWINARCPWHSSSAKTTQETFAGKF